MSTLVDVVIDTIRRGRNSGQTASQIAAELNAMGLRNSRGRAWCGGTVTRLANRRGLPLVAPAPRPFTEVELERARVLVAEGVLGTFIAEDLCRSPRGVNKQIKNMPGARERTKEWRVAWAHIRRNPTMAALHREFSPKG